MFDDDDNIFQIMSLRETGRFQSYLQRDKEWLNQLYCSSNSQNDRRILNFASDTKLDTLIKYLHFLSNGVIKIRRQSFESIDSKHFRAIKKHFESKASLRRLLKLDRQNKLKTLQKLSGAFSHLLYPLFNEQ